MKDFEKVGLEIVKFLRALYRHYRSIQRYPHSAFECSIWQFRLEHAMYGMRHCGVSLSCQRK